MQTAAPLELRMIRDSGQIITSTFAFLRLHWRPLGRAILAAGLPLALAAGFLSGDALLKLQQLRYGAYAGTGDAMAMGADGPGGLAHGLLILLIVGLMAVFAWMMVVSVVHEYIRAVHLGEHETMGTGELLRRGLRQIGPYFGASFLSGLLILMGLVLCILPALYPATVLSLALAAHAIERTGGAGALGRSNRLVAGDFFPTLGLVIIAFLIKMLLDQALVLPFTIAGLVIGVDAGVEAVREGGGVEFPAWMGLFNGISMAWQWCVSIATYPITAVAFALKYFSRVEETEGVGLKERIAAFDQT
ncbi:MAG: hypothetical protein ACK4L7_04740 [Flavobacteriales bacterium]